MFCINLFDENPAFFKSTSSKILCNRTIVGMRLILQINGNNNPIAAGIFLSPNFINCKLNNMLSGLVWLTALLTLKIFPYELNDQHSLTDTLHPCSTKSNFLAPSVTSVNKISSVINSFCLNCLTK